MLQLSTAMLVAFAIGSAITVLAMLRVLANIVEHETDLHDLRNRVKQLQYERELRQAQASGRLGKKSDEPEDAIERAIEAAEEVADAIDQTTPQQAKAA